MKNNFVNPSLLSICKSQDHGANAEDLFNQNRRLVLRLIADSDGISRKELAAATGLKTATISLVISQLLELGLIEESGFIQGDSGRKVMGFSLSGSKYCTIAIRMSPSYLKISSYDLHNNNLYIKKLFIDSFKNMSHTCSVIIDEIKLIEPHITNRKIIGVGLGIEGPFILDNGFYKYKDPENKGGFFDLGKCLNQKLNLPILVNRQTNFSIYELSKQERKENPLGIYVLISISYTVECGIMVNGEVINGANGAAGLLGDMLVEIKGEKPICLKDIASTDYVLRKVKDSIDQYPDSVLVGSIKDLNIRDVIRAYYLGDQLAVNIFTEVGITIGQMVADIVSLLNPDYIFVGDEIPPTVAFRETVENAAMENLQTGISPNVHTLVLEYEEARIARLDPALLGASSFVIDAFIQTIEFS
jgi:predicted NBD/HSP70 family sugar kinase